MPSRSQLEQLKQALTLRSQNKASNESTYVGRDQQTGLSLIQTAAGAIIPAHIEGNAQPFNGESLFSTQSEGIAYALGRSVSVESQSSLDLINLAQELKVPFLFQKGFLLPSETSATNASVRYDLGLALEGFSTPETPGTQTSFDYTNTTRTTNWNINTVNTNFTITNNVTRITGSVVGLIYEYILIKIPREIETIDISFSVTLNVAISNDIQGRVGVYRAQNLPPSTFIVGFSESIAFGPINGTFNATFTHNNGGSGEPSANSNYFGIWMNATAVNSGTLDISITDITFNTSPGSIWVGGDRETPVKLKDTSIGAIGYRGDQLWSMAANQNKIFIWLQEWIDPATSTASEFILETGSNSFIQTNYNSGDSVILTANNWRKAYFDFEVNENLINADPNDCFAFYGASGQGISNYNFQGSEFLEIDINQSINGTPLFIRLANLESVEDADVEVSRFTIAPSCPLFDTKIELTNIEALAPPTEPEGLAIMLSAPYKQ